MSKRKGVDYGLLYEYMREVIIRKADRFKEMDKHELRRILHIYFHIPKDYSCRVLNELVEYGFISQISRGNKGIKYKIL